MYVSVAFCDTVVRGRGNGGGSNCVPAQGERSGFLVRNGRRVYTELRIQCEGEVCVIVNVKRCV